MSQPQVGHILVAVDFGEASAAAVRLAGELARLFGATLTAVHAESLDAPPYFTVEQIEALEAGRQRARAAAARYLLEFVTAHTPVTAGVRIEDGPAAEAILRASEGADLVVMGTHGYRGARRWWLGSVAERLVRTSKVPVLVTRAAAGEVPDAWRVLVLGPAGHPAEAWAGLLGSRLGGAVERLVGPAVCQPNRLEATDLVVVAVAHGESDRHFAPDLVTLLQRCHRPVLFVPDRHGRTGSV
jgi:nucleotide-binding universal stress UspA family protein